MLEIKKQRNLMAIRYIRAATLQYTDPLPKYAVLYKDTKNIDYALYECLKKWIHR